MHRIKSSVTNLVGSRGYLYPEVLVPNVSFHRNRVISRVAFRVSNQKIPFNAVCVQQSVALVSGYLTEVPGLMSIRTCQHGSIWKCGACCCSKSGRKSIDDLERKEGQTGHGQKTKLTSI